MAEDDVQLSYFAEALKARGIRVDSWKLAAFAEKKNRGESEAQIIQEAAEGTRILKGRFSMRRVLQGGAVGAIAVPVADWIKESRPSWRELVKGSPKTVAVGALLGSTAGWIAAKLRNDAVTDAINNRFENFKENAHGMEIAWAEALKRVEERERAAPKER